MFLLETAFNYLIPPCLWSSSFTGAFTNQIQAAFREPRLMIVADPRADHQPVTEGSYANIPVIAFANVDSPTKHIDIAIPCNNKSPNSIGLMWWFLAREVRFSSLQLILQLHNHYTVASVHSLGLQYL